jgi:hypothetical protein
MDTYFDTDVADTAESISESRLDKPVVLGAVSSSSAWWDNNGLDWALIAIEDQRFVLPNVITVSKGHLQERLCIERIATKRPPISEALAVTGSSGVIKCRISGSPSFIRMPGSIVFQETWVVQLERPISEPNSPSTTPCVKHSHH